MDTQTKKDQAPSPTLPNSNTRAIVWTEIPPLGTGRHLTNVTMVTG